MMHNDIITIKRTSQSKDPVTHIAKTVNATLGPYKGRLGRVNGGLTQNGAENSFIQSLRLYVPDVTSDIKKGDILILNSKDNYIVDNVYKPNNHHIEVDLTYKGDA